MNGGLPAIIPGWERAKLPAVYEHAKRVLSECDSIDECRRWNARAEAIASYYRQAKDETMVAMARRIQLRAWRRLGELLKEADRNFDVEAFVKQHDIGHGRLGGSILGEEHGLSASEISGARKMASLGEDVFDQIAEREKPPTFSQARVELSSPWKGVYTPPRTPQIRLEEYIDRLSKFFLKNPAGPFRGTADMVFVRDQLTQIVNGGHK